MSAPTPSCPACAASEPLPYGRHKAHGRYKDWVMRECGRCGLVWIDPLPGPVLLDFMYRDTYEGATASYFAKVGRKLRRSRRRVAQIVRHARQEPRRGRFLDIGCNGGFMAEAARARGFEAWGLDVDPVAIAYARAHFPLCRFETATLEDFLARPETGRFDAAYCSEVIEHVPEVDRFMRALADALAPGGVLYLTTPDIGHWRRPKALARWDGFAPPAHCLYFRPASLRRLVERHGLSVIRTAFAWKPGIKMLCRKPGA